MFSGVPKVFSKVRFPGVAILAFALPLSVALAAEPWDASVLPVGLVLILGLSGPALTRAALSRIDRIRARRDARQPLPGGPTALIWWDEAIGSAGTPPRHA